MSVVCGYLGRAVVENFLNAGIPPRRCVARGNRMPDNDNANFGSFERWRLPLGAGLSTLFKSRNAGVDPAGFHPCRVCSNLQIRLVKIRTSPEDRDMRHYGQGLAYGSVRQPGGETRRRIHSNAVAKEFSYQFGLMF